jgi:hypothetical protein
MSEASDNLGFQSFPIEECTCSCCEERYQLVTGKVYDDEGNDLATCRAQLIKHGGEKWVSLEIGLLVPLAIRKQDGKIVTEVTTEKDDPLGRVMAGEEAPAGRLTDLILEVGDFILEADPHIGPFLEEDGGQERQEGK